MTHGVWGKPPGVSGFYLQINTACVASAALVHTGTALFLMLVYCTECILNVHVRVQGYRSHTHTHTQTHTHTITVGTTMKFNTIHKNELGLAGWHHTYIPHNIIYNNMYECQIIATYTMYMCTHIESKSGLCLACQCRQKAHRMELGAPYSQTESNGTNRNGKTFAFHLTTVK